MQQGKRLGRYEILSVLGRGGMGEVWRAHDTRLDREIAIKMLPEPFANDPERLARLRREARLLASVSHPNIAIVYDLEQADDATFLALELVEGQTLAERLLRGAIAAREALTLALQIAEALEAAHERGVIHRDLKPANIKITPDGKIKVLDFGIAKAFEVGRDDGRSSLTTQNGATEQGAILGTAAYMAPEQARGEPVDARADVWAFGCVLFEMLTGQEAFEGETTSDVLAAALKGDPDWSRLPKNLHPRVRHVLERCLEKRRRDRLAGISDARVEIARTLADPRGVLAEPVTESPQAWRRRRMRFATAVLGAVLVSALAAGVSVWQLKPSPRGQVMHFVDELPLDSSVGAQELPNIDISRDGTQYAYFAGPATGQQQLYVRALADPEARLVQGVAGVILRAVPRFSPDGRMLAYFSGTQIVRVPVEGGTPQPIVRDLVGTLRGMRWDDERIVYAMPDGIYDVAATGTEPPRLLVPAGEGEALSSPQMLPGGHAVLFTVAAGTSASDWSSADVVVHSLTSGERTLVVRRARDPRYLRSGYIVYAQGTALYALAFDLDRLETQGAAVRMIADGIGQAGATALSDTAQYAVSDTGSLVYLENPPGAASRVATKRSPVWVDRTGTPQPIELPPDDYSYARISPDGRRVAFVVGAITAQRRPEIWILELATGDLRQLTFGMSADAPVWSRDSTRLYFRSSPTSSTAVYSIDVNSGEREQIFEGSPEYSVAFPVALTPNEQELLLINSRGDTFSIVALGVGTERAFRHVLDNASLPALSRNGDWMAAVESRGARPSSIVLRNYPNVEQGAYPVADGTSPVFSRDGSELYFTDGDAVRAVSLTYEPDIDIGEPRELFRGRYSFDLIGRPWDVDRDGRFLVLQDAEDDDASSSAERQRIHGVANWIEEVQRRLP